MTYTLNVNWQLLFKKFSVNYWILDLWMFKYCDELNISDVSIICTVDRDDDGDNAWDSSFKGELVLIFDHDEDIETFCEAHPELE